MLKPQSTRAAPYYSMSVGRSDVCLKGLSRSASTEKKTKKNTYIEQCTDKFRDHRRRWDEEKEKRKRHETKDKNNNKKVGGVGRRRVKDSFVLWTYHE